MGAFGIAMDALTSFTGIVMPGTGRKHGSPVSLHELKLTLSNSANQAIKEFTTGMSMLQKHSQRLSANANDITRENLLLLNNNLKSCPQYRKFISDMKTRPVETSTWGWVPFVETAEISAGFLFIQPGNSVCPNARGENITLRESHLHDPFSLSVTSENSEKFYHMYLNQFGTVSVLSEIRNNSAPFKLNKLNNRSTESRTTVLKQGNTFVEDYNISKIKRLTCLREPCLLLSVHLPA